MQTEIQTKLQQKDSAAEEVFCNISYPSNPKAKASNPRDPTIRLDNKKTAWGEYIGGAPIKPQADQTVQTKPELQQGTESKGSV